jgi:hypothetical protein
MINLVLPPIARNRHLTASTSPGSWETRLEPRDRHPLAKLKLLTRRCHSTGAHAGCCFAARPSTYVLCQSIPSEL